MSVAIGLPLTRTVSAVASRLALNGAKWASCTRTAADAALVNTIRVASSDRILKRMACSSLDQVARYSGPRLNCDAQPAAKRESTGSGRGDDVAQRDRFAVVRIQCERAIDGAACEREIAGLVREVGLNE